MTEMALTVRGLCKAYPRFRLEDVSLNVPRGTCRVTFSRWKRGYALQSPRTVNAISVIMVPPDKTV